MSPRELLDEWTTGFDTRNVVMNQLERELIGKLNDPRIRYLDFYTTEFDHAAHHNRDRQTHLLAMQDVDSLVGRIWTAIQNLRWPPIPRLYSFPITARIRMSVYSQGYNLVKLGSQAGGGHHVITKRRVMNDYALKGIYPLVPLITTTTPDSYYLKIKAPITRRRCLISTATNAPRFTCATATSMCFTYFTRASTQRRRRPLALRVERCLLCHD
jgi:hypothetical protein